MGAREDIGNDFLAISEVQLLPANYSRIIAPVTKLEKAGTSSLSLRFYFRF